MCGVGCAAGAKGEMLLCGFKKGHRGKHAWATLPTFVDGKLTVDDRAVDRAAEALRHTMLGGSPEGTKALHEHALNVALIAVRTYLGREKG
jgi:hypothetical protein